MYICSVYWVFFLRYVSIPYTSLDSKVHWANMGPTWVLSDPDGPHVGPRNLAIRVSFVKLSCSRVHRFVDKGINNAKQGELRLCHWLFVWCLGSRNHLHLVCRPVSSLQWRHNEHHGVSNHHPYDCLLNRLFRRRSNKTSKLLVTDLCVGNSPVTDEFPAQMASDAENVSIWWHHHIFFYVNIYWK